MSTAKKASKKAVTQTKTKPADAILSVADAAAFDAWLSENHDTSPAVMLHMGKKGHVPRITWDEAVEVALCWGWIDSVRRSHDATSFLQRIGRRTRQSPWSQINVGRA